MLTVKYQISENVSRDLLIVLQFNPVISFKISIISKHTIKNVESTFADLDHEDNNQKVVQLLLIIFGKALGIKSIKYLENQWKSRKQLSNLLLPGIMEKIVRKEERIEVSDLEQEWTPETFETLSEKGKLVMETATLIDFPLELTSTTLDDEPSLKLIRSIGEGRTSLVYEGIYDDEIVAVKIAKKKDYLPCFEREITVLEDLANLNSPHIPKVLLNNESTIVMSQLGERVNNFRKKDIKDIITTLKEVHSRNIIHRDLRKYNFLRDSLDNILIIDWGYSTYSYENSSFTGALDSMPDEVLESIIKDYDIVYGPKIDLICFIRSFYLMIHRISLDLYPKDDIKTRAQMMMNFWNEHGKSELWGSIYLAAENLDYTKLIQEMERLF
ncbi:kinase-like domain-containing protein [Rhizophagus clarus]|uniref:Kinase-like domain-containing protein n=1 Tax=Rhizophagus clarus TaxID=94130 RepID=A0A8H3MF82_9GLOM|nr:kinase-like domain-containing protein [Rhizophagus clarus]